MNLRGILILIPLLVTWISAQEKFIYNGKQEYQDGAVMAHTIGSGGLNNEYYFYILGVACENRNPGFWDTIDRDHKQCKSLTGANGFVKGLPTGSFDKFCTNWGTNQNCNANLAMDLDDCLGSKKGSDALQFINAYSRFTCGNVRNTEAHLADRFTRNALIAPGVFKCFENLQDRIANCVKKDKSSSSFCSHFYTVQECYGKYYTDYTCNDPSTILYMRDLFQSISESLKCPQNQNDWYDKLFPKPPPHGRGWDNNHKTTEPSHGWGYSYTAVHPPHGWSNDYYTTIPPPPYGSGWGGHHYSTPSPDYGSGWSGDSYHILTRDGYNWINSRNKSPLGSWYQQRYKGSSKGSWGDYNRYGTTSKENWGQNRLRTSPGGLWDDNRTRRLFDLNTSITKEKIPPYNVRYEQSSETTSGEDILLRTPKPNRLRAGDKLTPSRRPRVSDKYIYNPTTTKDGKNRKLRSDGPSLSKSHTSSVEKIESSTWPTTSTSTRRPRRRIRIRKKKRKGSSSTPISTTTTEL